MFSHFAKQTFGPKPSAPQQAIPQGRFEQGQIACSHEEFSFISCRNAPLVGSFFRPSAGPGSPGPTGILIIVPGNSGDRSASMAFLERALPLGLAVASFDFNGRGMSEPLPLSYGFFEHRDLALFIEELVKRFAASRVFLWGRSMGAATCLWYCSQFLNKSPTHSIVKAVVVDSPFLSFPHIVRQQIGSMCIPSCLSGTVYKKLNSTVRSKYGIEMDQLSFSIDKISCQDCFFVVGGSQADRLTRFENVCEIEKLLPTSKKLLVELEGDHWAARPPKFFADILGLIIKAQAFGFWQPIIPKIW